MKWFRLYDDLLDDPKAQQLNPALFKHWVNLLCLASKTDPRGTLPPINDVAFRLRVTAQKARSILKELTDLGLIDRDGETLHMHNWQARQPNSDNVTARVRKHRKGVSGNDDETLQKRGSNALDTDTEKETEGDNPPAPIRGSGKRSTLEERFQAFWSAYPKKVAKDDARKRWQALKPSEELLDEILTALDWQRRKPDWLKDNGQFIPNPATWLNRGCWQDEPPAGVVTTVLPAPDDPVAKAKAEKARLEGFMASGNWHEATPYERQAYTVPPTGADNYARKIAGLNKIIDGTISGVAA